MINIRFGDISIKTINNTSGFFWGEKNSLKKFHSDQLINEVVGHYTGNENIVINNHWIKDKKRGT